MAIITLRIKIHTEYVMFKIQELPDFKAPIMGQAL